MEQNNSPDELIEIKPDIVDNIDDDSDMTINESEPALDTSEPEADIPDDVTVETLQSEEEVKEPESDDFSAEFEELEREEEDLHMLEEIGDSIVMQVDAEIENSIIDIPAETLANAPSSFNSVISEDEINSEEEEEEGHHNFFARIPWWGYTLAGVVIVISLTVIWILATKNGHSALVKHASEYAAGKVTYQPVEPVTNVDVPDEPSEIDSDVNIGDIEVVPDDFNVVTPELNDVEPTPYVDPDGTVTEKTVYNVLLVGEENIGAGGYRGRSDLIMIASINLSQKSVKLTSVMRDSLVAIPGFADNRINAAYAIGGVSLLYDTLKMNLGIDIDNYMLVNFDSFENIVDALGGIDVEVTAEEAGYLNTTNYIENPADRKIVAGTNHMNGGQVLGYCRIRNVGTATNEYSDFGRTSRQRRVLSTIYDMAANMNYFGLMGLAGKCLPYVTTDMDAVAIEKYCDMLLDVGMPGPVETFRVPISGSYSDVMLREMLVTRIDLDVNAKALKNFIYGEE